MKNKAIRNYEQGLDTLDNLVSKDEKLMELYNSTKAQLKALRTSLLY